MTATMAHSHPMPWDDDASPEPETPVVKATRERLAQLARRIKRAPDGREDRELAARRQKAAQYVEGQLDHRRNE